VPVLIFQRTFHFSISELLRVVEYILFQHHFFGIREVPQENEATEIISFAIHPLLHKLSGVTKKPALRVKILRKDLHPGVKGNSLLQKKEIKKLKKKE